MGGISATIEAQLAALTATADAPPTPLPRPRVTRRHGNEPAFDLRTPLHHLSGAVTHERMASGTRTLYHCLPRSGDAPRASG